MQGKYILVKHQYVQFYLHKILRSVYIHYLFFSNIYSEIFKIEISYIQNSNYELNFYKSTALIG